MKKKDIIFLIYTLFIMCLFVYAPSRESIETLTSNHPYLMGFVKTSILATSGELLASRILAHNYFSKKGIIYRFIIWGFLGFGFVLMFHIYAAGVSSAINNHLLPTFNTDGFIKRLWEAFLISLTMNLTFAPAFMLLHRVTDQYIELSKGQIKRVHLKDISNRIDWKNYFEFVILKTIPLFWIPAHTITFLLPETYRVLMAGILSIALGLILSLSVRQKQPLKTTISN